MNTVTLLPIGTRVLVTLAAIGGRTETVPGTVVSHCRRSNIIETEGHGRVVVNADRMTVFEHRP